MIDVPVGGNLLVPHGIVVRISNTIKGTRRAGEHVAAPIGTRDVGTARVILGHHSGIRIVSITDTFTEVIMQG